MQTSAKFAFLRMLRGQTLLFGILFLWFQAASAQTDFSAFWNRFKSAVARKDKGKVAEMTRFPMSIYASHIKNRAEFLRRYDEVFKGEASDTECFASAEPQKESVRSYAVYCPLRRP
jgi:hypothetical protein